MKPQVTSPDGGWKHPKGAHDKGRITEEPREGKLTCAVLEQREDSIVKRVLSLCIVATFLFLGGGCASRSDLTAISSKNVNLSKQQIGRWQQIDLPPLADRMQAVNIALLPSGKVLIANGSSNRNTWTPGSGETVIEGEKGRILGVSRVNELETIDNIALYEPGVFDPKAGDIDKRSGLPVKGDQGEFTRIRLPSEAPQGSGIRKDLFCAGQLHLPNGNVLFVGGTETYYAGESFSGNAGARVFRWDTEEWVDVGPMKDGHWYPNLVPLEDGRVAVFGGLKAGSPGFMSTLIEIYDYTKEGEQAWSFVDAADPSLVHSPYNTKIPNIYDPSKGEITDGFQMYPRIYPLPDGRLLMTHDGVGWVGGGDATTNTYLVKIGSPSDDGQPPSVEFELGPARQDVNKIYGTAVADPTTGDILLIAGQKGPANANTLNHGPGPYSVAAKGVQVTADMERFILPNETNPDGSWEIARNFLGDTAENVRMNANVVILPTKQLVVVGGGNFGEHHPLFTPPLLTPDPSAPGGYTKSLMEQPLQPRLYHSTALLLPDGRVFTAGGNAQRALYIPDDDGGGSVKLNVYKDPHGAYKVTQEGEYAIPAEIWEIEIFSPPYMYVDTPRPAIRIPADFPKNTAGYLKLDYGQKYTIQVENMTEGSSLVLVKLGAVTHAWDSGQRLIDLEIEDQSGDQLTFTAPQGSPVHPPGYYMLFYVSESGQPSESQMVQLGVS